MSVNSVKKIIWYYGSLPYRFGFSTEKEFVESMSAPTVGWSMCLQKLSQNHHINCEVHTFTKSNNLKAYRHSGLEWKFYPIKLPLFSLLRIGNYDLQSLIGFSPSLLRDWKQKPPNLSIFYGIGSLFSLPVAKWLRIRGIPYIVKVFREERETFIHRYIYRNASRLWAEVEANKKYVKRELDLDDKLISTIPQPINPASFYKKGRISSSPFPVLGFAGRLDEHKNFLLALKCFARIKEDFPNAVLRVAGNFISKGYKTQTNSFIRSNSLSRSLKFCGVLKPTEMGDFYRSLDLLLFPSRKETFGRVLAEAMMCGVPGVALKGSGGPDSIIKDGEDGILSTPENFITEVLKLLQDRGKLKDMSRQAAIHAKEKYRLDAVYPKFKELCLSLL